MKVYFGCSFMGFGGYCVPHALGLMYFIDRDEITFNIGLLFLEAGITISWKEDLTQPQEASGPAST